jgi:hypothetical protein
VDVAGEYIVETDDPRWIANQRAVDHAPGKIFERALALLDVRPTTAAAIATLFRYVAAADELDFPENVLMDDQDDSDDGVDFQTAPAREMPRSVNGRPLRLADRRKRRRRAGAPSPTPQRKEK